MRVVRRLGRLTVCGHDGGKHWLDLVHCHYAMSEESLEEDTVNVCIALVVRYIAN